MVACLQVGADTKFWTPKEKEEETMTFEFRNYFKNDHDLLSPTITLETRRFLKVRSFYRVIL
jgi:hypothetical protein